MRRKSQEAFDLLSSYGWILLAVVLILAALMYFGIISLDMFTPEQASIGAGITVQDYKVSEESIEFTLKNNAGKNLYDFVINVTSCNNGHGAASNPIRFTAGDVRTVTVECLDAGSAGSMFKSSVSFSYFTRAAVASSGSSSELQTSTEVPHTGGSGKIAKKIEGGSIKCNALITGCGYTGWQPGTTYCLVSNIVMSSGSTCLLLNATSITIDGKGHTITGTGTGTGISILSTSGANSSLIKNLTISNMASGIVISGSKYNNLTHVSVTDSATGISLGGASQYNRIISSIISSCTDGLKITYGTSENPDYAVMQGLAIFNSSNRGINIDYADNGNITGCNLTNNTYGISLVGQGWLVENNTVCGGSTDFSSGTGNSGTGNNMSYVANEPGAWPVLNVDYHSCASVPAHCFGSYSCGSCTNSSCCGSTECGGTMIFDTCSGNKDCESITTLANCTDDALQEVCEWQAGTGCLNALGGPCADTYSTVEECDAVHVIMPSCTSVQHCNASGTGSCTGLGMAVCQSMAASGCIWS